MKWMREERPDDYVYYLVPYDELEAEPGLLWTILYNQGFSVYHAKTATSNLWDARCIAVGQRLVWRQFDYIVERLRGT